MILDGIAGIKFLVEGKFSSFTAILKAHFGYYHYVFFKKDKQNLPAELQKSWPTSYSGSILKAYFLEGKKQFDKIKF
jgi:hypothetical protein